MIALICKLRARQAAYAHVVDSFAGGMTVAESERIPAEAAEMFRHKMLMSTGGAGAADVLIGDWRRPVLKAVRLSLMAPRDAAGIFASLTAALARREWLPGTARYKNGELTHSFGGRNAQHPTFQVNSKTTHGYRDALGSKSRSRYSQMGPSRRPASD